MGDIVLFLKSEREYDEQYQYGIVCALYTSEEVEYKKHNESIRRTTKHGVRDLIIVHHIDELHISE